MNPLTSLTKKHRLFVEAYAGDEVSAMLAAGFQGAPNFLLTKAQEFLKDPIIQEAIKERSKYMAKTFRVIADREERQSTLSAIMRNEDPHYIEEKDSNGVPLPPTNIPLPTRLKALELLGKSEGDFIDKVEHSGSVSLTDLVMSSYKVGIPVEAIEAEYYKAKETPKLEAPSALEDFL